MFRYNGILIVTRVKCGKYKKRSKYLLLNFPYKIRSECTYFLFQFLLLPHKMTKCQLSGLQVSRISNCFWYVSTKFSYFSGILSTILKLKPMFYTLANVLGLK